MTMRWFETCNEQEIIEHCLLIKSLYKYFLYKTSKKMLIPCPPPHEEFAMC
jgi:hypothetical protein